MMTISFPGKPPFAIHATLIHSTSSSKIEFLPDTLLVIDISGRISHLVPTTPKSSLDSMMASLSLPLDVQVNILPYPKYFLIPGLIDTHVHAPQHSMRGIGSAKGMHILEWLDQLTFPHETRFSNPSHAQKVYQSCIASSLKQGITTACYHASLHPPATKILADLALAKGQRAFIGKVCMDNASTNPEYYCESLSESIEGTREVIEYIKSIDPEGRLVRPVITPRFAISCMPESLRGLGGIAAQQGHAYGGKGILTQTHFCEAEQEVDATLIQYPGFTSEVDLYSHYGLFNEHSVLAHCTTVTHDEIKRMKDADVGVAHCPIANVSVGGGFMAAPVKKFLDEGMKVGLGTDSGGGFSSSILDAMRQAVVVGNAREVMTAGKEGRVGLEEVIYMGTLGGARVLGMGDEIGVFGVGKCFDAVVVDTSPEEGGRDEGVMTAIEEGEGWERILEKFVMTADDRNMVGVFVNGRRSK